MLFYIFSGAYQFWHPEFLTDLRARLPLYRRIEALGIITFGGAAGWDAERVKIQWGEAGGGP